MLGPFGAHGQNVLLPAATEPDLVTEHATTLLLNTEGNTVHILTVTTKSVTLQTVQVRNRIKIILFFQPLTEAYWLTLDIVLPFLLAVDGGWSEWTDWLPCSTSCGTGHSVKHRQCTDPQPQHGGRECGSDNVQYKACKSSPCLGKQNTTTFFENRICNEISSVALYASENKIFLFKPWRNSDFNRSI